MGGTLPPTNMRPHPPAPDRILLSGHNVFDGGFLKNHSTNAKMGEGYPRLDLWACGGVGGRGVPHILKGNPPWFKKRKAGQACAVRKGVPV